MAATLYPALTRFALPFLRSFPVLHKQTQLLKLCRNFRLPRRFNTHDFNSRQLFTAKALRSQEPYSYGEMGNERYDVIVVGGGHAGCEAALASARLGAKTLLLTLNIDRIAWQPCNPAVGGPAKSQLVHEVDALGGEIAKVISCVVSHLSSSSYASSEEELGYCIISRRLFTNHSDSDEEMNKNQKMLDRMKGESTSSSRNCPARVSLREVIMASFGGVLSLPFSQLEKGSKRKTSEVAVSSGEVVETLGVVEK